MAFTLWDFLLSTLLFVNSIAILNEERFLARIGWGKTQAEARSGYGDQSPSVKRQMINLMAARTLFILSICVVPLIVLNLIAAALLMIFG